MSGLYELNYITGRDRLQYRYCRFILKYMFHVYMFKENYKHKMNLIFFCVFSMCLPEGYVYTKYILRSELS